MSFARTVVCLSWLVAACSGGAPAAPAETKAPIAANAAPPESTAARPAALTRVADPSTVCMINDQHMGAPQIPVQVDGKTYYGCCQACEAKLKSDAQARLGTDPVTQKPVDKALAVIAKDARGKVLYFESEDNMRAFASKL